MKEIRSRLARWAERVRAFLPRALGPGRESPRFGPDAILLAGGLKVGKSTLFSYCVGRGIGRFVYGATGVELTRGAWTGEPGGELIDAPGIYSLHDRSEDAFVVRDLLVRRRVGRVVLVLDAKNLRRSLPLAFQLAEFRVPVVVALNMEDEGRRLGVRIDVSKLAALLGVPVVPTVAVEGQGIGALRRALGRAAPISPRLGLPRDDREWIDGVSAILSGCDVRAEGLAYLLALDAPHSRDVVEDLNAPAGCRSEILRQFSGRDPAASARLGLLVSEQGLRQAEQIVAEAVEERQRTTGGWSERLGAWTRRSLTGIPIALAILALTYAFVGWVGADLLVDLVERRLFLEWLMPAVNGLVDLIPVSFVREMLVGPFGLISVGIVLSFGIVLPVLATYFLAFAVLEDSGYLPRLSILADRVLRRIGLNGKGVLPLIMGFSCVTMAILTARMLDTRKQRTLVTLLLVSGIPCAPLLGVMIVLLVRLPPVAAVILVGVLVAQFLLVGALANLIIPGKRSDFVLELPPLRPPRPANILRKTGLQLFWFFREAIPLFLLGALVLFAFDQLGALEGFRAALRPVLGHWLGLPPESADVFLMTFIRREVGAGLLVEQHAAGLYDGIGVVVMLLVMSLLAPCVNALLVMFKERGPLTASAILMFTIPYALAVGALVNAACRAMGLDF